MNDVIYSGPDELNVLSHVLARFRMGKYALMADLSKCFSQITQDSLPGTAQVHELRAQTPSAHGVSSLTYIIDSAPSRYILKKRTAYLMAFSEFIKCKTQHKTFVKPRIDSAYLDKAMHRLILYVLRKCFGTVMKKLKDTSPDCFEDIIKKAANITQAENIKETTAMLQS